MRILLPLFLCLLLASCRTNRNVYQPDDSAAPRQTIAVLPFQITQTGYKGKNFDTADVRRKNEHWSGVFQESLYAYLARSTSRNRRGTLVAFQALQKTNALLAEQGLSYSDLYKKQPEELARLLGVDAVLMSTIEHEKNFSDGVAYGLAAGRKILNVIGQGSKAGYISANVSDIRLNTYLYHASDSRLLWQAYRKGGTDLPNDVDELVTYYSNWVAKRFPYRS